MKEKKLQEEEFKRMEAERKIQEEQQKIEEDLRIMKELEELQFSEYDKPPPLEQQPSELQEIVCPECNQTIVELSELDNHQCMCKHCLNPYPSYLLTQHYILCPNNNRQKMRGLNKLTKDQRERKLAYDVRNDIKIKEYTSGACLCNELQ